MYKQILCSLFILISLGFSPTAQNIETWISGNETNPVEKIYIHTDSEYYFSGDTVWFKVYLTDSRSGQLIPRAENAYINVLDANGNTALQLILLCVNGQAAGNFTVSDTFKPGSYLIKAYTNYLFNFSPDSYFYKQINISGITVNSRSTVKVNRTPNMVADVAFLPEGGVLLENTTNLVAFKAIDKSGFGVDAGGTVKDEKGTVITSFKTDYRGMGLLFLKPEPGKKYVATVVGFPSFRYEFQPVKQGIKIQLVNHTNKEVILNVSSNSQEIAGDTYYLVNMYRGEVLFYQEFKMEGTSKVLKFESGSLKPGINRLVLLDKNLAPVSERLLFSRNDEMNNLIIQADSKSYDKRSEIKLKITDEKYLTNDDFSNLSVSVIHEASIPENSFSKNILSQFLVDSELMGFVEPSAYLFSDSEISSEAKLRLVMLTNGYSSYFWNSVPRKNEILKFKQEAGLNLQGVAKNSLTGNYIENGEITIAIQKNDEIGFLTQRTDNLGNFTFPGLLFIDTANVHIQAKNELGRMNTEAFIYPVFKSAEPAVSQVKRLSEKMQLPTGLASLKYQIYNENRKYQPRARLNRKKVNTDGKNSDGHFRLYESADFVLQVDQFEQSYDNVLDYMVGRVPGLDINADDIRIRGTSGFGSGATPMFLVDGVPVVGSQTFNLPFEVTQTKDTEGNMVSNSGERLIQTVRAIPISDVDKIEILKSPQNLAVFGIKGANGVIAIYTKHGRINQESKVTKRIIENKIVGYSKYRDFYSPMYTPENQDDKKPDLKILLYWNPNVITVNGSADLRFFSSSLHGRYKIVVEGITNDGKICMGYADFEIK